MNEVDELLLEHFGVRGMHWGIRSDHSKSVSKGTKRAARDEKWKSRTTKQKVAIGSAAFGLGFLLSNAVMGRTMSAPLTIVAGAGGALAGAKIAGNIIDKRGNKKISEVRG